MAAVKRVKLGIRDIRELGEGCTIWDARISGFCARRRKSSAVFYALKYRTTDGRQRWYTIGRHGAPWTPDTARTEAQRLLAEVVQGNDPAASKLAKRLAATVAELCDDYLLAAEHGRLLTRRGRTKKESTVATVLIKPVDSIEASPNARKGDTVFMHPHDRSELPMSLPGRVGKVSVPNVSVGLNKPAHYECRIARFYRHRAAPTHRPDRYFYPQLLPGNSRCSPRALKYRLLLSSPDGSLKPRGSSYGAQTGGSASEKPLDALRRGAAVLTSRRYSPVRCR
jgi:hypothetical protein